MWARKPWTNYAQPCKESSGLLGIVTQLAANESPTKSLPDPQQKWHPTLADFNQSTIEEQRAIVAWAFNYCNILVPGGARGKPPKEAAQCIFDVLEASRRREFGYVQPHVKHILQQYPMPNAVTPVAPKEPFFWEQSQRWILLAAKYEGCKVICVEWPQDLRRRHRAQTQPFSTFAACLEYLENDCTNVPAGKVIVLTARKITGWKPEWIERQSPLKRLYAKTLPAQRLHRIRRACRAVRKGSAVSADATVNKILGHALKRWKGTQLDPDVLKLLCIPHYAWLLGGNLETAEELGIFALFNCFWLN